MLCARRQPSIGKRQVQKSDRINSDRQSGSDQLGSTRIDSDRLESWKKKQKIKWNIETSTHLKENSVQKWTKSRKTRNVSLCRAVYRGGTGGKSPSSLLSEPISLSSLLFWTNFSLLPTFFGPFPPPPYAVPPPFASVCVVKSGALLGSKFSQVISSLSKICVITISSISQIDPSLNSADSWINKLQIRLLPKFLTLISQNSG